MRLALPAFLGCGFVVSLIEFLSLEFLLEEEAEEGEDEHEHDACQKNVNIREEQSNNDIRKTFITKTLDTVVSRLQFRLLVFA